MKVCIEAWRGALFGSLLVMLAAPAMAAEFDRGEALYENHCRTCHESWPHERGVRKVDSYPDLRARVASWSLHSGLNWGEDEIDDVTDYLNRRFYQLAP